MLSVFKLCSPSSHARVTDHPMAVELQGIYTESVERGFDMGIAALNEWKAVSYCCCLAPGWPSVLESLPSIDRHRFICRFLCLLQAGFDAAKRVIVVCSTTGNGDPPNNAEE